MPKRKAKNDFKNIEEKKKDDKKNKGIQREEEKEEFVDEEVERQIAAIRAMRDVEIEQILTALRLLRSYFTEEQLDMPVLEFFKEDLPNLSIVKNEESGMIELKWKDEIRDPYMGNANDVDMNHSILKRLSMGFPDLYSRASLGGYDLPENVKTSLLSTDNQHLENLGFQGTSQNQMLASHDAFQTPGVNGQRLSFGMTPKTEATKTRRNDALCAWLSFGCLQPRQQNGSYNWYVSRSQSFCVHAPYYETEPEYLLDVHKLILQRKSVED